MGSEPDLADAICRLAALRAEVPALRRGSYRELFVAPEQLAFARELDGNTVIVLLNAAGDAAEVAVPAPVDGGWRDLLNGGTATADGGELRVEVPAGWGSVLRAE
jgi:hypothetical protein